MPEEEKIVLFTDGGSRGNPGPAGIGVYIETLNKKYGEYIGETTNNDAEYQALIFGLKKIKSLIGKQKAKRTQVQCYLDSELIVKQLHHEYKVEHESMQKLFFQVWNSMLDFKEVKFSHVVREKNTIADSLVNQALDKKLRQGTLM
jgi:ribonuclease HI